MPITEEQLARLDELDEEEIDLILDLRRLGAFTLPPGTKLPNYKAVVKIIESKGLIALVEEVVRQREQYMYRTGRELTTKRDPADQRKLDHFNGYWAGALWAVGMLPDIINGKVEKDEAKRAAAERGAVGATT